MDRFILLRDRTAAGRRTQPHPVNPVDPPERVELLPEIETVQLSAAELRDAARDPSVRAIARAMPTRLIEPEPLDEARPDDATPGWGLIATGADTCPLTGAGVRVALLDTGIDAGHPAFAGLALQHHDFAGSGNQDANGHGTHVAGTIFGREVGGKRIGLAPGIAQGLIAKVLTDDGHGSTEMLFNALCWAVAGESRVISMSLAFDFHGYADSLVQKQGFPLLLATEVALESYRMNQRMFDTLLAMLRQQSEPNGGFVLIAAVGNDSRRTISPEFEVGAALPAAAEGVLSVAALAHGSDGLMVAPFSNTGAAVSAPGVGIVSATPGGGLRALNGTSMASAHVTGIATLWAEALARTNDRITADTVATRLLGSVTSTGFASRTDRLDRGLGLVQAPQARIA